MMSHWVDSMCINRPLKFDADHSLVPIQEPKNRRFGSGQIVQQGFWPPIRPSFPEEVRVPGPQLQPTVKPWLASDRGYSYVWYIWLPIYFMAAATHAGNIKSLFQPQSRCDLMSIHSDAYVLDWDCGS
ncbi:hypothetical protein BGX38DRAFT_1140234 [Terfezia claveryi]|nr:hypothetical protein BGX38DRAFT_1140234 [Terfezia claveryi]